MKIKYKNIDELKSRAKSRAFKIYKTTYQNYLAKRSKKKRILFILGCQRSGTSLMMKIFDNDIHTKVYGEFSELSATHSDPIRLAPYPQVFETINSTRAVSIVMKPLVNLRMLRISSITLSLQMHCGCSGIIRMSYHQASYTGAAKMELKIYFPSSAMISPIGDLKGLRQKQENS